MQRINEPEMIRQGKYADIVSRGEAIYQQLKNELEGSYRGQYVAINIVDGKYAIASSELEAIDNAKEMCDDSFVGYLRGIGFVDFFGSV
jgi:hypothetical protein